MVAIATCSGLLNISKLCKSHILFLIVFIETRNTSLIDIFIKEMNKFEDFCP